MSYSDYLSDKQFPSAKEQGKPVADWLATEEGHEWQDSKFRHPNAGTGWHGNAPLHLAANDERLHNNWQHHGLFSYKDSGAGEPASWPEPERGDDLERKYL